MKQDNPYEMFADEYEAWFSENHHLFMSEVEAIRRLIPEFEKGIEVGVGTGLFAQKLGIKEGIEPSSAMRAKAESRGIVTYNAAVENLPFADSSYDLVLMVTVDCFLQDLGLALREIYRVLKTNGSLIIAFLDHASPLGEVYDKHKESSPFYASASFNSASKIKDLLQHSKFKVIDTCQTVFDLENREQDILPGTGEGIFAVVLARKL